ncbi:basic proline-rich protein-like [Cebus imitator]|uniref:basic proline-rich protein-like n=1 Tax=Cebus imitator TaxID=2715852 RepID=UPI0018989C00|nr:basic proline-rich protein-like [Cebus imitator]
MVADPATRPGFPEPRAPARRSPAQDCPGDAAVQPGPPRPDVLTPGLSRSVRPRPGPPAGSLRGLSRSRWRWKLVGINPGREGPGLGVGEDPAPGSPRGCRGSVCAYVLGLCPSRGPSVHFPGPASLVRVAKGEATSETKVSEKERRFPAPVGAVSSSLPDRASGSAPGAPREQRWTPLGLAESLGLGPPPGTPLPTTCTPTRVPPAPAPLCSPDPPPPSGRARIVAKETVPPRFPEAPLLRSRKPGGWPMGLLLSPPRLLQPSGRRGANGRQGTPGAFLIGRGRSGRVRLPCPPEEPAGGSERVVPQASPLQPDLSLQNFSRPHLPSIMFYENQEIRG